MPGAQAQRLFGTFSAVSDPPPRAVVVRPAAPTLDRTVGVVWRTDHRHKPAADAFLALLRERASLKA
jgi:DNA-binding transcriptional LysR family regulator